VCGKQLLEVPDISEEDGALNVEARAFGLA